MRKPLIALTLLAIVGSVAAWYLLQGPQPATPLPETGTRDAIQDGETPAAAIEHPLPAPVPDVPLPSLAESDEPFGSELSMALGNPSSSAWVNPDNLIRHIVASVDNLPRRKAAVEQRPVRSPMGPFAVEGDEVTGTLSAANYPRYDSAMDALRATNLSSLVALYKRFYPLFQRAYQDLGYPDGYFNDRLIAVIDHLLATPSPPEPIGLVRPNVFYEFADPRLEALSTGQKLLIRIGPAHRTLVMGRLKELRAELAR